VELSNVLTMKELLKIKKDFLSYDKDKIEMITQEDARDCYIKYIEKLR
jgi:Ca2+-binding EF-hand superfamily protein